MTFKASAAPELRHRGVSPDLETASLIRTVLRAGDLELDCDRWRVSRGDRELNLGPMAFRLLAFLMRSPGRVFSRKQLRASVWGRASKIGERAIDIHIGRLRKMLNPCDGGEFIRTVYRGGYIFDDGRPHAQRQPGKTKVQPQMRTAPNPPWDREPAFR